MNIYFKDGFARYVKVVRYVAVFVKNIIFFVFFFYFNMLILKINFKKLKKYYFNIFSNIKQSLST